ncbi:MAG TPA: hypothetical protein VL588_12285 [Bdellovibrionota bacterium]|jgi:hypothetical protein|nr:hypothetical protein [Bdellovibrionota bacterium]
MRTPKLFHVLIAPLQAAALLGMAVGGALMFKMVAYADGGRGKVIDFEEDLVEGVNKKPYDSLSQLSEKNRKKRAHLYRKRPSFREETEESRRDARWHQ